MPVTCSVAEDRASRQPVYPINRGRPRVLLTGAGFSTGNMGVSALASGTLASIWHSWPNASVAFFDYGKEPVCYQVQNNGSTAAANLRNVRFSKSIHLSNNIARLLLASAVHRFVPIRVIRKYIEQIHPRLQDVLEADLIVSIAGGDSFSDIYGLRRLIYIALPQILSIWLRVPLVLLPQTIGPFATQLGRQIGRYILSRAAHVYVRDAESLTETQQLLRDLPKQTTVAYDMAFALEPRQPQMSLVQRITDLRAQGQLVGLNVSGLLIESSPSGENKFKLRSDYAELTRNLIRHFLVKAQIRVILVPHVFGGIGTVESDTLACEKIWNEFRTEFGDRLQVVGDKLDHHQVKFVIGQCDFFLGARMHACIAAISQSVPAVGLAYSRKFAGVFRTVDVDDLVVDLTHYTTAEVVQHVEALFNRRAEIRRRLESIMPRVRKSVLGLFGEIISQIDLGNVPSADSAGQNLG